MMQLNEPGSRWWRFEVQGFVPVASATPREWLATLAAPAAPAVCDSTCAVVTDHSAAHGFTQQCSELALLQQQDAPRWAAVTLFPGLTLSCSDGVQLVAIFDPTRPAKAAEASLALRSNAGCPDTSDSTALSATAATRLIHAHGAVAWADRPASDSGSAGVWVKLSTPTLDGLRLALADPDCAVRFGAQHPQPVKHASITRLSLDKLSLRSKTPLTIHFNPGYNALIGGRGSGKSTVLECLRLGLARDNELHAGHTDSTLAQTFELFKKVKDGRQPGMMLEQTRITVEVSKGQGEFAEQFQYQWAKGTDLKFAVTVSRREGDTWQPTQLNEAQARQHFPVQIFSQKQILTLANHPQQLLNYADDVLAASKAQWQLRFAAKRDTLQSARARVAALQAMLAQLPEVELVYLKVARKAKFFSESIVGPDLMAHQRASQQQQAVAQLFGQLDRTVASLSASVAQAEGLKRLTLADFAAATPAEQAEHDSAGALVQQLAGRYDQLLGLLGDMRADLAAAEARSACSAWRQDNQAQLEAFARISAEFSAQGISNTEDASVAVAQEAQLKQQLEQLRSERSALDQAKREAAHAQAELQLERQALTTLRQAFFDEVLASLPTLKITLHSLADPETAATGLREFFGVDTESSYTKIIYGEDDSDPPKPCGMVWDLITPVAAASVAERLQEVKQSLEELNSSVLNTPLNARLQKKLKELKPAAFDGLAAWFPEDAVDIQYQREPLGAFQSLQQASAGQKTAAILSFLLAHGSEPLLMDQPEDDLDNGLISALVVKQISNNKYRRQLVVITHNANIVVNGDAELVIPMAFVDGEITNLAAGGLQERAIREKICEVMEGGTIAFEQRYKRIVNDLRPPELL